MNKLFVFTLLLALLAAIVARADDGSASGADAPLVTTLFSDGSTNTWTQADLVAALGLMNRKYHRDMESESGRRAWHGKCTTTNDFDRYVKVWLYEDGFIYETPIPAPKPKVEKAIDAAARAAALAAKTNGVPGEVAQLYAKRAKAEVATEPEVVTIEIGGAK